MALPVRVRHGGSGVCVFVDGMLVGEFPSVGEAVSHAWRLARS